MIGFPVHVMREERVAVPPISRSQTYQERHECFTGKLSNTTWLYLSRVGWKVGLVGFLTSWEYAGTAGRYSPLDMIYPSICM
jgi:hypothetical protein